MSFIIFNMNVLYASLGLGYLIGCILYVRYEIKKSMILYAMYHIQIVLYILSPILIPWFALTKLIYYFDRKMHPELKDLDPLNEQFHGGAALMILLYLGATALTYNPWILGLEQHTTRAPASEVACKCPEKGVSYE